MYSSPRFGWYGVKPRTGPLNTLPEVRRFRGATGLAWIGATGVEGRGAAFFDTSLACFATVLLCPFGPESFSFDTFFRLALLGDFTVFFDDGF
jgi:hypothetical protein